MARLEVLPADAIDDADRSELIAGYSCPAGSVVFFSECGAIST